MFDPAGVFCRGLLIYAERYEESRQNFMTVVDSGGNCIAGVGKGDTTQISNLRTPISICAKIYFSIP